MENLLRILFVEDSDDDTGLQVQLLERAGYKIEYFRVDAPRELIRALDQKWDLIVSDYSMPYFTGTAALKIVRDQGLDVPFIFVSGTTGEDTAVAVLKAGAQNYLTKSSLSRLVPSVERELREAEERRRLRRLEEQVHRLRKFEAVGRLASGVAHDFNNVIEAILGWAEIGKDEAEAGSRVQQRFFKIRAQAERAAGLTRQLLAFARRQLLQPCNTDVNELVREAVALLRNTIGERIEVDLKLSPDLCVAWADPSQVEQVLMNLCLNARDAMPDGGRLSIETDYVELDADYQRTHAWAVPGRYAMICVQDTGAGIDPEDLEHIFEPFVTTKKAGEGPGLGLATVYGIVKQHRGFVDVESRTGQGATFRVYLPIGKGAPRALEKEHDISLREGHERILFAEDNEGLREVTAELLGRLGYDVLTARDGQEAVLLFEQNLTSVELLLLDAVMSVMNGTEAFARICRLRPQIPVIFTTGHATEINLFGSESQIQSPILHKPYSALALARKLREILDKKEIVSCEPPGNRD